MEINAILSKLNQAVPGAVLQKSRFGKSDHSCIWIDSRAIARVAAALTEDPEIKFDWLENLSVSQLEENLICTYFVRSWENADTLILRVAVALESADAWAEVPSITRAWPMAAPMEREAGELFGIRFIESAVSSGAGLLPEEWRGFPLRKTYVFPNEVFGIEHSRERSRK